MFCTVCWNVASDLLSSIQHTHTHTHIHNSCLHTSNAHRHFSGFVYTVMLSFNPPQLVSQ